MPNPLDCFDHVVVLMMENRSFDNMLGYLSDAVDGVVGRQLSNPVPVRWDGQPVDGADLGPVPVSPGEVMDNPNPDPGEYFPHVNTQLYNVVSAWTTSFNVVSTQMDHCSMLRTLEMKWGLDALTRRDAASPDFLQEVFNSPTPRSNTDWPVLTPLAQPPAAVGAHNLGYPLNDLQKAVVGTVNHVDRLPQPVNLDTMTVSEALAIMRQKRAVLEAL
jgi:phospholipase C